MRMALMTIFIIHALIHLLGFLKAFNIYSAKELTLPISKFWGVIWLLACILVIIAAVMYGFRLPYWWLAGLIAVILSQVVIIYFWQDAKFGTIINVLFLLISIYGFSAWQFEGIYKEDVRAGIQRTDKIQDELLVESDIDHLPAQVQKYIRVTGFIGKPKVKNIKVTFEAQMRSKTQDWFDLTVEQHNFFDASERLFFLKANVKGLPTDGYHKYSGNQAGMLIKLLSVIPIVHATGAEMFKAETVTLFNDMCFLAPATLIDDRIKWEPLDSLSVKAEFTNRDVTVSAILYFNQKGELINFESDDRFEINEMKQFRFTTPLSNYRGINGLHLATYGEAVWHYPEGPFVYGKYTLKDVRYNVTGP